MGTWFKKFSCSTITKVLAIVVLCVAVLGGLGDAISIVRGIEYGAYENSYEETSEFLWEHLVPTASYVRD